MARIGLQLYTIRGECDRDLADTLRRVGKQGYEGVELFQLHGHLSEEVRGWLDAAGLAVAGRHAGLQLLEESMPIIAREMTVLGSDRVAISWADPAWLEQPSEIVERIHEVAVDARNHGLRLGFHNHAPELRAYESGKTFLDLLRELPPDLLWLELDLGWVWHAGADPIAELEKTQGRCPLVHVKDYRSRDDRDDVPVGQGMVGYERVLPAALAAGAEWLIVEEDEVEGDPFDAVEQSLHGMRTLLGTA